MLLLAFEACDFALGDFAFLRQLIDVTTNLGQRHAKRLGNLGIETLTVFFKVVENGIHVWLEPLRRCEFEALLHPLAFDRLI